MRIESVEGEATRSGRPSGLDGVRSAREGGDLYVLSLCGHVFAAWHSRGVVSNLRPQDRKRLQSWADRGELSMLLSADPATPAFDRDTRGMRAVTHRQVGPVDSRLGEH